MSPHALELTVLPDTYGVCRLNPSEGIPEWAVKSPFFSVTRTAQELSVVTLSRDIPAEVLAELDWRVIGVLGPLDFNMTGVLASLATPLAQGGVPIFVISTYDTDYILVKDKMLEGACHLLTGQGHQIVEV